MKLSHSSYNCCIGGYIVCDTDTGRKVSVKIECKQIEGSRWGISMRVKSSSLHRSLAIENEDEQRQILDWLNAKPEVIRLVQAISKIYSEFGSKVMLPETEEAILMYANNLGGGKNHV